MFGHIPMLAHHDFAEMARAHRASSACAAIAAGEGHRAARLYWHSVEFGLAKEGGELKILGAGLASSFGESHFSLESDAVERLPFSVERAVNTPYKHDAFQPRYLVSAIARADDRRRAGFDSGAPARAIGRRMADQPTTAGISQRARSAHAARRARLLRDRGDGGHLPRRRRRAGRADGQQLHLGLARPAAAARLPRTRQAASAAALTEASHFAINVLQTGQQPASIRFSTRDRGPLRDDALVVRRSGRADPQGFARRVRMRALRGL